LGIAGDSDCDQPKWPGGAAGVDLCSGPVPSRGRLYPRHRIDRAGGHFPRSLHFAPLASNRASPGCDPVPVSASSIEPAGGPAPSYVVASGDGLQLFADCTRIGVSANEGDSWTVRRVPVDVFAATISASGTILALGFLPGDHAIFQLESSDSGRSWTRHQLTGLSPSRSDALTCSPSGIECRASRL
jgi:hypothetical protein